PRNVFADRASAETDALRGAASAVSTDEIVYLLRAFLDADAEMRRSPYPRVEMEIAAVRTTRRPEPQALDSLLTKVEEALGRLKTMPAPGVGPSSTRPVGAQESLLAAPPVPGGSARVPGRVSERPKTERPPVTSAAQPRQGDLEESWQRIVAEIMAKKALLGSVLQHATPVAVADGVLQLALAGNHFHRDLLGERTNRELINQAVQKHLPGAHRFELDADGGGAGGARNHPAVQAALNAFQGEVVAVRPRAPEEGEPQ